MYPIIRTLLILISALLITAPASAALDTEPAHHAPIFADDTETPGGDGKGGDEDAEPECD